jgi:penicillin-insensitive murein endopeptidase
MRARPAILALALALAWGTSAHAARWARDRSLPFPQVPRLVWPEAATSEMRAERCNEPAVSTPPLTTAGDATALDAPALARQLQESPSSLGSASFGQPTRGALWGGAQLGVSASIYPVAPIYAWGTAATVASLERAARIVACRFAGTPPLPVGSISKERGGPLFPHRSHQSGLDADVSYYALDGTHFYKRATAANLDRPRTWALIEALVEGGNVEYLFMARDVQGWLREHAQAVASPELVRDLFDGTPARQPLIRHARGHTNHFHVRFVDETARRTAARIAPFLVGPWRALLPRR